MKTILVPIDLTAAAEHTLVYANKLAVRMSAAVVLVYCHPDGLLTPAEEADYQKRLEILAERLRYVQLVRQDGRRIRYQFAIRSGCLHDQIQGLIDQYGADLLVMNLEHIDCGSEAISGNHAVRIAELASCPVLVVPPGTRPLPQRLAFLADFAHLEKSSLPSLVDFVGMLRTQLHLVHFYQHLDLTELIAAKKGMHVVRQALPAVSIDSKMVLDDDPLEGIGDFCAQIQAQLLVFAPSDGTLLSRFFDVCYTKTRAYHIRIPVLVLPQPLAEPVICCQHCAERVAAKSVSEVV
jgi:nucleotide-binding universal stress UspA family protein